MITSLSLKNFKSHKDTTLNLDDSRLHAIVGPNGSGKTSILQIIDGLSQLTNRAVSEIFQANFSPEQVVTSGESYSYVNLSGHWGTILQDWSARLIVEQLGDGTWDFIIGWTLEANVGSCWPIGKKNGESGRSSSLRNAPWPIPQALGYSSYLKLESSQLAKAAYSDDIVPTIGFDGSGLAPTLDYLRGANPKIFRHLEERLRQVIPLVQGIDVRRAKVEILRQRTIEVDGKTLPYEERREVTGQEIVFDTSSGERIPGHAISEGTILTLGLLTILHGSRTHQLILLDDIEQGLHPQAQRDLINLLKQILAEKPELQILFTTHSPYIIDELNPSQIHVLNNAENGFTIAKRLDEHPNAEWATETLTTGEFWDAEGEEWVLKEVSGV